MAPAMLALPGPAWPSLYWGVDDAHKPENGRPFLVGGRRIRIPPSVVDAPGSDHPVLTARTVWDCSVVHAKHLERLSSERLQGKRVLELGSGCGVLGIAAAFLGAQVTMTDRPEVISSLEACVRCNSPFPFTAPAVEALDWTMQQSPLFEESFDIVLAADVVWLSDLVDPLIATMARFIKSDKTTGQLCYQSRSSRCDAELERAIERHGLCMRLLGPDEAFDGEYRRDAISLYEIGRS